MTLVQWLYTLSEAWSGVNWADLMAAQDATLGQSIEVCVSFFLFFFGPTLVLPRGENVIKKKENGSEPTIMPS